MQDLVRWADLYSSAGIILVSDQNFEQSLDVKRTNRGALKHLITLGRWDLQPQRINYNDLTQENFLLPDYYTTFGGQVRIHYSHVIRRPGGASATPLELDGKWLG
jgi:uncharacterized protein